MPFVFDIPVCLTTNGRSVTATHITTYNFPPLFPQINVVHFNNTPIADMLVYLLEEKAWSSHLLQNLTTDSHGTASFSLNTTRMDKDNFNLIVSMRF
jgi:hypothetical protein